MTRLRLNPWQRVDVENGKEPEANYDFGIPRDPTDPYDTVNMPGLFVRMSRDEWLAHDKPFVIDVNIDVVQYKDDPQPDLNGD